MGLSAAQWESGEPDGMEGMEAEWRPEPEGGIHMGLFEKLMAIPAIQPFLEQEDSVFIEDPGWREILQKVKQLRDTETVVRIVQEASPVREKEKIVLGYLCTMAAELSEVPVDLLCVDYAGCYLGRGALKLKTRSGDYLPGNVGMGMKASGPDSKISVSGNVGDHLGYRAPKANIEVKGSVRDRAGMAVGDGTIRIEGDVAGGLGGNAQSARLEVDGSVGRINRDNFGCKILIAEDVHWGIGDNQADCFIKVCGNVGMKYKSGGKLLDIAPGLSKNSALLVGGDVFGNIGTRMEIAKILVWGRVHGETRASDNQGGFIYLNKKSTSMITRAVKSLGGDIGIKYVTLKESGYLFAEDPEDIKEIILG
jgi:formylmethanofuran dehydrogenase subunit C